MHIAIENCADNPPSVSTPIKMPTSFQELAARTSLNSHLSGASGCSQDSVAYDTNPHVTLTRYETLPTNTRTDESNYKGEHQTQKSISAVQLHLLQNGSTKHDHNKLWTIAAQNKEHQRFHRASLTQTIRDGTFSHNHDQPIDGPRKPQHDFQLVWKHLSYRVDRSGYDKIVDSFLHGLRSICGLGSVTSHLAEQHNQFNQVSSSESSLAQKVSYSARKLVSTNDDSNKRIIFEDLNGCVKSGQITAILGPSGSGKTSLLNAICGKTENYSGQIELLGGQGGHEGRRMRLSIIPQKDYLIENLTVRENLLYSSRILNPDHDFNHEANISRVIKMLNLSACYHSFAGNISGGEYKRVSIAQELLRQPDILVLDEPTSGLDSLNCKKLIQSLAQLSEAARSGNFKPIAIILTIHQPDVDIFNLFDHVYCMAPGGFVIYDGPPRLAMETVLQNGGLALADANAQTHTNPANLLIEIASLDLYGPETVQLLSDYQRLQFDNLHSTDDSSQLYKNVTSFVTSKQGTIGTHVQDGKRIPSLSSLVSRSDVTSIRSNSSNQLVRDKRLNANRKQNAGLFWYHTGVLARRAFVSTLRDPLLTIVTLMFHLSIPFGMWLVYPRQLGTTNACPIIQRDLDIVSMASNRTIAKIGDLQDQLATTFECSTMFFLTTYAFSMCCLTVSSLAFPLSMHILLKEVRNGWYSLPSYVLAKTLANIPFEVLFPVLSLIMIYLMMGMPSSTWEWRLCAIALVMALVSMISHTQGLIFGALCMDSVQTAIFISSALSLPQCMLSGFTARIRGLPVTLQYASWLSQYRYSSDLINMIRFGFGICPCDDSTENYMTTHSAVFKDIPKNLKPIFLYYLANSRGDNSTADQLDSSINGTESALQTHNVTQPPERVPGVDYEIMLNDSERAELLQRMESDEVNLFESMADMMGRSFTYGRQLENCQSVRSQLLMTTDAPPDNYMAVMFACMFGLLVALKIILFLAVRYKIGSRV